MNIVFMARKISKMMMKKILRKMMMIITVKNGKIKILTIIKQKGKIMKQ